MKLAVYFLWTTFLAQPDGVVLAEYQSPDECWKHLYQHYDAILSWYYRNPALATRAPKVPWTAECVQHVDWSKVKDARDL